MRAYSSSKGIATLVEKPMAGSLAESEQLVAQARASRTVLQVGHIERFNPALLALENLAVRPKFVNAERLSTYTFRSTDIGVVFDLMIHDLDLLLSLIAAPVRSVAAVGVSLFGEHEDVANARIEFEDGSVANLTASRASYTPSRKMRIWGAEGYASLDFAAKEATVIRPSEQLKRGRLDLEGVDLSQPAVVREHLFGKILRVDRVQSRSSRAARPRAGRLRQRRARNVAAQGQRRRCLACSPAGRPGLAQPRNASLGCRIHPDGRQASRRPRSCAARMPGEPGACGKSPKQAPERWSGEHGRPARYQSQH